MTTTPLTNETRFDRAGRRITATRILGTPEMVLEAWEVDAPAEIGIGYRHTTITYVDGFRYGTLASRELPAEIDALEAGSSERREQVLAWQAANKSEALEAIRARFADMLADERIADIREDGSTIRLWINTA